MCLAACLALLAGCATPTTVVDRVWRDDARAETSLGKTLVLALTPEAEISDILESEWTRQLRGRGVDAFAFDALRPDKSPRSRRSVVELVKARGFDTLLVSRVVDVKRAERDVAAYQVAVVETKLYDTRTEQPFWSARSDTFLVSHTGDRANAPRDDRLREFVATVLAEMYASKAP